MKETKPPPVRSAFTLVEMMIVVAIVGVLAAMAIPKMTDLVRKSREGATKANLAVLRSALRIYYGDTEGFYPTDDLACLTFNEKYLTVMPGVRVPGYHDESTVVKNNDDLGMGMLVNNDLGEWMYWNWSHLSSAPREWGDVWIGCTHPDLKGVTWTNH